MANKSLYGQSYDITRSHIQMWELDHKEGWASKNQCFWTVVMEKTLESPLNCKEVQPVHPEGDQSGMYIERTAKAEAPMLWLPKAMSLFTGKDLDTEKDWGQNKKEMAEDEMVR